MVDFITKHHKPVCPVEKSNVTTIVFQFTTYNYNTKWFSYQISTHLTLNELYKMKYEKLHH